jgi:hypothetical protein
MSSTALDTERVVYGCSTRGGRAPRRQHTWSRIAGDYAGADGVADGVATAGRWRRVRCAKHRPSGETSWRCRRESRSRGPTCCTADSHK